MSHADSDHPIPLWPELPRYCEQLPRPIQAYTRGHTPHPGRDSLVPEVFPLPVPPDHLRPALWRENLPYLYGVDLYHEGYLWESHEAWEYLWAAAPRAGVLAEFLQSLILNSAAQIKRREENYEGARTLSLRAVKLLSHVQDSIAPEPSFMGLDLAAFASRCRAHYFPVWNGEVPAAGRPPCIVLEGTPDA